MYQLSHSRLNSKPCLLLCFRMSTGAPAIQPNGLSRKWSAVPFTSSPGIEIHIFSMHIDSKCGRCFGVSTLSLGTRRSLALAPLV